MYTTPLAYGRSETALATALPMIAHCKLPALATLGAIMKRLCSGGADPKYTIPFTPVKMTNDYDKRDRY